MWSICFSSGSLTVGSSHHGAFRKHLLLLLPQMQVFVVKNTYRKRTCMAGAPAA